VFVDEQSSRRLTYVLLEKKKATLQGGFFKVLETGKFLNRVTVVRATSHQIMSYQCSLNRRITQDSPFASATQWLPPVAIFRVYQGWIQVKVT